MKKYIYTLFTICLLVSSLEAEDEIGKQVWLDLNPRWYSTDDYKITGQFGVRQSLNHEEWIRYVVKPAVAYSIYTGLDLGGGMGLDYTDKISVQNVLLNDRLAVIPFIGINYVHSLTKRWKMNYYFRTEGKFDYDTEDWQSVNSLRFRLRIRTIYEFDAYEAGRYFRATLSWEGFTTVKGDDGFTTDKSRVTVGLERSFTHNQKGCLELTWQRQTLGLASGDSFNDYSDIYLRLRYYPSWGDVIRNKFWNLD